MLKHKERTIKLTIIVASLFLHCIIILLLLLPQSPGEPFLISTAQTDLAKSVSNTVDVDETTTQVPSSDTPEHQSSLQEWTATKARASQFSGAPVEFID